MPESTFTFRVDDSLKAAFAHVAKHHDRTAAQLLRDFMRQYVSENMDGDGYHVWYSKKVEVGLQAYHDEQFISHEDAKAEALRRKSILLARSGNAQ